MPTTPGAEGEMSTDPVYEAVKSAFVTTLGQKYLNRFGDTSPANLFPDENMWIRYFTAEIAPLIIGAGFKIPSTMVAKKIQNKTVAAGILTITKIIKENLDKPDGGGLWA